MIYYVSPYLSSSTVYYIMYHLTYLAVLYIISCTTLPI